ncbi:rifin, partial [Plasmodium reichenowi]
VNTHTKKHPSQNVIHKLLGYYASVNYMHLSFMIMTHKKTVMKNFSKQTQQRYHDYDELMKTTLQKCKDRCYKEIQKIILKDKLEKELMDKFATLHPDIQSDAIPICICEKSVADKVEKNCLKYGRILGMAVPEFGSIGGTLVYAAAVKSSVELGIKTGIETTISDLEGLSGLRTLIGSTKIKNFVTSTTYGNKTSIVEFVMNIYNNSCAQNPSSKVLFCNGASRIGVEGLAARAESIAEGAHSIGADAASEKFAEMTSASVIFSDPLVISAIVVVTIAAILLIIYLILRYRRKKKMKKKLQYIKLLEE